MSTITPKQEQLIADLLTNMILPSGLGTRESACSIAAINLALSGRLSDDIPYCMSEVIGRWIIGAQDSMPSELRNSSEWKRLLPLAAGSGRDYEQQRLNLILDWMWGTVLPVIQPLADRKEFGAEWRTMLEQRSVAAANALATAAANAAADAAYAAEAARAAANAAADAAQSATWQQFNPCGLLQRLIAISQQA